MEFVTSGMRGRTDTNQIMTQTNVKLSQFQEIYTCFERLSQKDLVHSGRSEDEEIRRDRGEEEVLPAAFAEAAGGWTWQV